MRVYEVLPVTFVCYAFNLNMGAVVRWRSPASYRALPHAYGLDVPTNHPVPEYEHGSPTGWAIFCWRAVLFKPLAC